MQIYACRANLLIIDVFIHTYIHPTQTHRHTPKHTKRNCWLFFYSRPKVNIWIWRVTNFRVSIMNALFPFQLACLYIKGAMRASTQCENKFVYRGNKPNKFYVVVHNSNITKWRCWEKIYTIFWSYLKQFSKYVERPITSSYQTISDYMIQLFC